MTTSEIIADARRTVKIVEEAEDAKIHQILAIIGSFIRIPHSCAHPRKKLTKQEIRENKVLEDLSARVAALLNEEDIPF